MSKKHVTETITYQEMVFARLVLTGTMTDRQAAEVAGLYPDTAALIKEKPAVRAYMREHSAAVAGDEHRPQNPVRERVLTRLWELANLSHEATRNSISGQVKAISMIASIEGLIPERRAAEKPSAQPSSQAHIYQPHWLLVRKAEDAAAKAGLKLVEEDGQPHIPNASPATASSPVSAAPSAPGPTVHSGDVSFAQPSNPVLSRVPDADSPFLPGTNGSRRR
jgi:hypothetical protein